VLSFSFPAKTHLWQRILQAWMTSARRSAQLAA
jgi:hypothetical protein